MFGIELIVSAAVGLDCCFHYSVRPRQLAVGTCEIVMLNRDSSVPRRTIARQTARCACRRGQIAGTTRARPACVDARIVRSRQWCEMAPCMEGEVCGLLFNRSGWTCTRGSGRIKTVTVIHKT
uniref:TAFA chemokine like family member 5, like n=1 Tax=Myripristis murdjan TaxID=586833 RepID=A0A668AX18_9TELE